MVQRLLWLRPLVLLACSLAPQTSFAADDSSFAAASAAFERGDYASALTLFEATRASADGPAVPFNIGVCLYKLGRYAEAEAEFASLAASFPTMRALAEYNRGLALLGAKRDADARAAFSAASAAGDPKITALSAERLDALRLEPPIATKPSWQGYLQAGAGHDDNVALVEEITLPAGQSAASPLLELLGFGGYAFGGPARARVDFGGYFVRYEDASQFDEDAVNVAATFARARGEWSFELSPRYERSTLGGNAFESEAGIAVRVDRPLGRGLRFGALAAYDDVGSLDSQYDSLEGAKRLVRLTLTQPVTRGRFTANLELEDNNRAAASVSSTRRRAMLDYRRGLGPNWSLEGAVAYRLSSYDRPSGDERLTEVFASARRVLGHDWAFTVDYRHSNNDADLPEFTYSADRIAVGVNRVF
jgi:tetratricopeptide (TPR) repeat protein